MSFLPSPVDERTRVALHSVIRERVRQEHLWGVQHHPFTMAYLITEDDERAAKEWTELQSQEGTLSWWSILTEEFVEAMWASERGDLTALRDELVQVAAVACAMIEDLDSREDGDDA